MIDMSSRKYESGYEKLKEKEKEQNNYLNRKKKALDKFVTSNKK